MTFSFYSKFSGLKKEIPLLFHDLENVLFSRFFSLTVATLYKECISKNVEYFNKVCVLFEWNMYITIQEPIYLFHLVKAQSNQKQNLLKKLIRFQKTVKICLEIHYLNACRQNLLDKLVNDLAKYSRSRFPWICANHMICSRGITSTYLAWLLGDRVDTNCFSRSLSELSSVSSEIIVGWGRLAPMLPDTRLL